MAYICTVDSDGVTMIEGKKKRRRRWRGRRRGI
jgi:hypothetical protein